MCGVSIPKRLHFSTKFNFLYMELHCLQEVLIINPKHFKIMICFPLFMQESFKF